MKKRKKVLLIILGIIVALIVGILVYAYYLGSQQRLELQLQVAKTDVNMVISNINNYCTIEEMKVQQGMISTKSICVDSKTIKENIDKITDIGLLDSVLALEYSNDKITFIQAKYKKYKLTYTSTGGVEVTKLTKEELKQIENGTYNTNEMDKENTSDDNISDDENIVTPTYPIYEPNSTVQEVINQFMNNKKHKYYIDIYSNEELSDYDTHALTLYQVSDLIIDDQNCNKEKYSDEEDELYYECRYIKYDDFNNKYKSMFGSDATKNYFSPDGFTNFIYDKENNVYRISSYAAGGGEAFSRESEVIDSKEEGNYLYIYEKVAYVALEDKTYIIYPHDAENDIVLDTKYYEYISIKNDYLDDFDTYKWTFKKNNNGDYTFQKLEYVK